MTFVREAEASFFQATIMPAETTMAQLRDRKKEWGKKTNWPREKPPLGRIIGTIPMPHVAHVLVGNKRLHSGCPLKLATDLTLYGQK